MKNTSLISAAERISLIDFDNIRNQDYKSHHLLVQEFLRRATCVIHEYSITLKTLRYPFISAYDVMDRELDIDVLQWCPKLEEIHNGTIKYMCRYYLEWSALIDKGISVALEHKDLYEPLIQLLERGGSFNIRQNSMIVGEATFHLPTYRDKVILEHSDISEQYLDQLDLEQDMEIKWENEDGLIITSYLEYAQARITSINFMLEQPEKKSHLILINEFLRRAAYFERFLYLSIDSPFVNAVETLGYSYTLEIEEVCPAIQSIESELIKSVCINYLELSALVDQKVLKARKYYNLYEPMIKLFERGGKVILMDNNIITGSEIIPLADWYVDAITNSPEDISDRNLNLLDSTLLE
ncbi:MULTISPECIES: hypothetical protein [unclassified Brevibacillus]|uniref:hypothetical protein n=1 Tax=unclassified Brevibacillus TaxID=2684853 RepID=UPI00356250D5